MKSLLFEDPFWLYGILGIAFLVLLTSWWRNRDRAHTLRLAVPAGLIGLLFLVSTLVVTDREKIQRATRDVAAAVQAGDVDRVAVWLDRELQATYHGTALNRAQAVARLRSVLGQVRVATVKIQKNEIAVKGPRAFQRLLTWIEVTGRAVQGRVPVRWRVHWVRTASGWRIYEVEEPRIGVGN